MKTSEEDCWRTLANSSIKEHGGQLRDDVVEKFKEGLGYKATSQASYISHTSVKVTIQKQKAASPPTCGHYNCGGVQVLWRVDSTAIRTPQIWPLWNKKEAIAETKTQVLNTPCRRCSKHLLALM